MICLPAESPKEGPPQHQQMAMVLVCWMAYLQVMYRKRHASRTDIFTSRRPVLPIRCPVNFAKLGPSAEAIIKIGMMYMVHRSNEDFKQGVLVCSMCKQYVLVHAFQPMVLRILLSVTVKAYVKSCTLQACCL